MCDFIETTMLAQIGQFRLDTNSQYIACVYTSLNKSIEFATIQALYAMFERATKRGIFVANKRYICIDFFFHDGIIATYHEGSSTRYHTNETLSEISIVCPQRPCIKSQISVQQSSTYSTYTPTHSPVSVGINEVWEFVYKKHFVYRLRKSTKGKNKYQAGMDITPSFHVELLLLRSCLSSYNDLYIMRSTVEKLKDLYGRFENNVKHDLDFQPMEVISPEVTTIPRETRM